MPGCDAEPARKPPDTNLLLITVDTLRADHVSAYGYARQTTPAIERLVREGARFETAFAQRGETWPSLVSILTGVHPRTHGVRGNGQLLESSSISIAETLQEAGFLTAAFLTNMAYFQHRGFDEKRKWPLAKEGPYDHGQMDANATRAARNWIREHASEPFFVWLHLIGPHEPYLPPASHQGSFTADYEGDLDGSRSALTLVQRRRRLLDAGELAYIVSLYDEEVLAVDALVAEVLGALDDLGLRDETLVVLTADHGEELYDHDFYFFHSWSIYDSVLHIPLVMRLPGRIAAGTVIDSIVESVDLAPTLIELLRLSSAETYEGRSLVGLLAGEPARSRDFSEAFAELGPEIHSLRTSRWQYIQNPKRYSSAGARGERFGHRGFFQIDAEELYDLEADPGQQHNLADLRPDVARAMRKRLGEWLEETPSKLPVSEISPDARMELEQLGYIEIEP